jgi:hypothetical protein
VAAYAPPDDVWCLRRALNNRNRHPEEVAHT